MENGIRKFLAEQRVKIIKESPRGELIASCPFPDHTDTHASFAINKETGLYNCFGCGRQGSFERLYAELRGLSIWVALREVGEHYDLGSTHVKRRTYPPDSDFPEEGMALIPSSQSLLATYSLLERGEAPKQYLERGLTEYDWQLWGGRIDRALNLMTFPVMGLRGIVALIGRRLDDGPGRYLSYQGSRIKHALYGTQYISWHPEIVVVEGLLDTQRVYQVLHGQVDVVGLLSTTLSRSQVKLLGYWNNVALWLDNDAAGQAATEKHTVNLLSAGKRVYHVPYYFAAKDQATPGVLDECIRASFENRRRSVGHWTWPGEVL